MNIHIHKIMYNKYTKKKKKNIKKIKNGFLQYSEREREFK